VLLVFHLDLKNINLRSYYRKLASV
jgi:hypothetical protein